VGCRAFPKREKMTEVVRQWCSRNKHRAMCTGCKEAKQSDIPEVSIYQQEKMEKNNE